MLPLRVRAAQTMADPSSPWRRIIIWSSVLLGIIVIFGGILLLASRSNTLSNTPSFSVDLPVTPSDHVAGNSAAAVTVIEYGDFQCPACGAYFPIVQSLISEFGDRVRFVFRNFPLTAIHPNAQAAAYAAEAANLQGKYWQMNDLLFTKQSEWASLKDPKEKFIGYATSLGLDTTKFSSDMNSKAVSDRVATDVQTGIAASVNGTPAFFVNGRFVANTSTSALRNAIIGALQ